jgi:hypothetical protein
VLRSLRLKEYLFKPRWHFSGAVPGFLPLDRTVMKSARAIFVIALAAVLSACAPNAIRSQSDFHTAYSFSNFSLYHAKRDTRVDVIGDHFGLTQSAFAKVVTKAMYGNHPGAPTHFTLTPGPSAEKNLRVIMAFNIEPSHYLCSAGKREPRIVKGQTVLQAAWCWGDRTDSYVMAWTKETKLGDPNFTKLIAEATQELFPQDIGNWLRNKNRRPTLIIN